MKKLLFIVIVLLAFGLNVKSQTIQITNNINCRVLVAYRWMGPPMPGQLCKDLGGGNVIVLAMSSGVTTVPPPPPTIDCEVSVIVDPGGANIHMNVLGTTGACSGWPQFVSRPNTCAGGTVNCQIANIGGGNYVLNIYP